MESAAALEPHRWTREEFDRMVDVGLLDAEAAVELLDGVIVEMSPEGPQHSAVMQELVRVLVPAASEARLRVQNPMWASAHSEPQPDLAIAGPPTPDAHPSSARLAVEIAVTSHAAARVKIGIYAAAGVDEYWIVDVPKRLVEVFTRPTDDGYAGHRTLRGDDVLAVPDFGVETTVAGVFERAGLT